MCDTAACMTPGSAHGSASSAGRRWDFGLVIYRAPTQWVGRLETWAPTDGVQMWALTLSAPGEWLEPRLLRRAVCQLGRRRVGRR